MPLQLDPLDGLDSLDGLDQPMGRADSNGQSGQPLVLAIEQIDEDPDQPRHEFEAEALQQLADSIAEHGVLQAVSVHAHPEAPGRWVLNFGARRLRASKLAGKATIPAFVDQALTGYAQVTENEQRAGLSPMELALFVERRLADGHNQAEIARRLCKSRQYVTFATALIDAPEWLLAAYRDRRCRGLRELHELRRLHGEHAEEVEAWLADKAPVTRQRLDDLRTRLMAARSVSSAAAPKAAPVPPMQPPQSITSHPASDADTGMQVASATSMRAVAPARRLLRLQADLDGTVVDLVVDAVPSQPGYVFVRGHGDARPATVSAARLKLIGFAVA